MSVDKMPAYSNFPDQDPKLTRLVKWIRNTIYQPIAYRLSFLLSLVNSGFVEIPADDAKPGDDGNWRWRVDGVNLVLQLKTSGVWTDTAVKMLTTGVIVVPKASGRGIKVDLANPTYGFADLLGDQFSRNTGATKPTLAVYNGDVRAWQFGNGDEAYLTYHIGHDHVKGTDIHLHVHWSQNAAGCTGGTVDFKYTAVYAKGHNQAAGSQFNAAPITGTFSSIDIDDGGSGLLQRQHHLTEIIISGESLTAALFNRDDLEPDGVIELTLEMVATNLTGTPSLPFIHYGDIHYTTNGVMGTKQKAPDFYV